MKRLLMAWLALASIASCSQGGDGSGGGKVTSGAFVSPESEVVSELNQTTSLNSGYQLTTSEIEELFNSGTITEQQKQELLALVK